MSTNDVQTVDLSASPVTEAPAVEPVEQQEIQEQEPLEVEPEKKEEDPDKWAQRFAVLSRREKELQRKAAELKSMQENEEFKAFVAAKQSRNPVQALQSLGMSFEDAARYVLNDGKEEPPSVEKQLAELKEQIAKAEQERISREEQARQEYIERTIDNHKREIGQYVQANADKYELIAANDAQETVFEVIQEYYNKYNKIMSIEEASDKVEDWLTDRARQIFKLKKFQQASQTEAPQETKTVAPELKPKIGMTLTNSNVTAQPAKENLGLLSREESIRRAAAMIKFK